MNPFPPAAPARPRLAQGLRISTHSDGVVILDIQRGHIFSANAVGARIVTLLGENHSFDHIVERISAEFSTPHDRVQADLRNFVESMRVRGLLHA